MNESIEQQPNNPEADNILDEANTAALTAKEFMEEYSRCDIGSPEAAKAKAEADQAFAQMLRLTHPMLFNSAFRRLDGNLHFVEDTLERTYLSAWKGLPKFRGDAHIGTWLHRILYRKISDHYARKSREGERSGGSLDAHDQWQEDGLQITANPKDSPEYLLEQAEQLEYLENLLNDLKPKLKAVAMLRFLGHQSHEEISEALGITVSASKVRLSRARLVLQQRITNKKHK